MNKNNILGFLPILLVVVLISLVSLYFWNLNISTAASGPLLVDYQESDWITRTSASEATGVIIWQAGDLIVVVGGTEDAGYTINTPTATGLTFSLVTSTSGASNANTYLWRATAESNGSSVVMATVSGGGAKGIGVFVYRGSSGLGNNNTLIGSTAKTINLTRSQDNSAVVLVMVDWNAVNDVIVTSVPSGGTQREVSYSSGAHTVFVLDWGDQGLAGTTSYGITDHTGTVKMSGIVVEVKGQ